MAWLGNIQSYTAAAAITRGDRLKFSAGATTVTPAGATDASFAVAEEDAASGALVRVRAHTPGHVVELRAGAAFSVGAALYGAASGEVSGTSNAGTDRFTALEAAAAANELVSCLINFVGA